MVTASYVSEDMRKMEQRVKDAGIVILNEVGCLKSEQRATCMYCHCEIATAKGYKSS
jgi:hypothetical protein